MNRLLRRCVVAAVGIHLGMMAGGGWLAPRLSAADPTDALRAIDVALETPEPPARVVLPATSPAPAPAPQPAAANPPDSPTQPPDTAPPPPVTPAGHPLPAVAPTPTAPRLPSPPSIRAVTREEDSGGALNLGAASARGDLSGLPTGRTPIGWVPGSDSGKGAGSGTGSGIGTPEPELPSAPPSMPMRTVPLKVRPSAAPTPAAPPSRVGVPVCAASHLLPNAYCPQTVSMEFAEGSEPRDTCTLHKAPAATVAVAPVAPAPPAPAPPAPPRAQPRNEPLVPARLTRTVKPEYPRSAVESDNEGAVLLQVEVQADGKPGEIEVIHSSGNRVLDAAATRAVKLWRWEPARRGGKAEASTVRCRVRFELEEQ